MIPGRGDGESMRTTRDGVCGLLATVALLAAHGVAGDAGSRAERTAAAIRREALRPNGDPEGLPLPLAANWNNGWDRGVAPKIQMELIEQGHHLLPWINLPPLWEQAAHPKMFETADAYTDKVVGYYEAPLRRMAELNLPFTIDSTQWESALTYPPIPNPETAPHLAGPGGPWPSLPADLNPNVVTVEGTVLWGGAGQVSPFGPIGPWWEVGWTWTTSEIVRKLQEWHPEPPLVMFMSNNEHGRLELGQIETEKRYVERYGRGKDDAFKSRVMEQGFTERLRVLQQGMRDGMTRAAWKQHAIFCGYEVVDRPPWRDPPEAWDGGSPSYYNHDWLPMTDYQANSAAVATMRFVPQLREAYRRNPKLRWEISVWDGGEKKVTGYRDQGQSYDPPRYEGFIQFGMWLHRPRVVREFRGSGETWDQIRPFFEAVMAAVDRVHRSPTLTAFWRTGTSVENRANPYLSGKAAEYKEANPWFLLDTSLDPPKPWRADTTLPVFALALATGESPERRWLVYAHAPLGERTGVQVTIPDGKAVTIDVPIAGAFYLVDEKTGAVQQAGRH